MKGRSASRRALDSAATRGDNRAVDVVIENLSCRRAGRLALAPLSATVPAGAAALVVGPNGAGKSTLLRALAGFVPPASGDARIGGASLARAREDAQAHVAYAGHLDAVKPQMTVAETLAFWAAFGRGAAVQPALAALDLTRLADLPVAYCSAGQRRRLGLGRVLVSDRPVWLLDEPVNALDTASAAAFAGVLRRHLAGGGVVVAATHTPIDLPGAAAIAVAPPAAEAAADDDPFLTGAWS